MHSSSDFLVVLSVALLCPALATSAPVYNAVALSGNSFYGTSINSSGTVAGAARFGGVFHSATHNGTALTQLDSFSFSDSVFFTSIATGIRDDGTAAGYFDYILNSGFSATSGFLYADGQANTLAFPVASPPFSRVLAIAGDWVVQSAGPYTTSQGNSVPGLSVVRNIATGSYYANPGTTRGVNSSGMSVGEMNTDNTSIHAYVSSAGGNSLTLLYGPGGAGFHSEANGISDDGTVVGTVSSNSGAYAVAWRDGNPAALGAGLHSAATAISPNGQYILGYINGEPFVYTAGSVYLLRDVINSFATLGISATLEASAVNNSGQIVLVDNLGGATRTYRLDLTNGGADTPEPATAVLVLAGLALTGPWRKRVVLFRHCRARPMRIS